jgi:translation initiation factor IF-2
MANKRLYEVARDHKLSSEALMALVTRLGFDVRSHMSVATDEILEAIETEITRQKEALKAEIAVREKKTRERKAKARKAAAAKAKREADVARAAEQARKDEEERKQREAEEEAVKKGVTASPTAETPKAPPKRSKKDDTTKPARPAPPRPAPPKRPLTQPTKITGRPAGAPTPPPAPVTPAPRSVKPPARPPTVRRPGAPIPGRPAGPATGRPGSPARPATAPAVGGAPPRRRRRRGPRKKRQRVDQSEVAASFRKTIAQLGTRAKSKKRRRREGGDAVDFEEPTRTIEVNEFMSVAELAQKMDVTATQVVAKCLELGMLATMNQRLDMDTIETIALEFDYNVETVQEIGSEEIEEEEDREEDLAPRPPVVTIMGHVDHGKTSLLDYIRHSNIIAGESGGITQHIGAYSVRTDGGRITFLDTPGHAAFTAMRARGAQSTDIVILVVAADDAVMPQTIEAIDHAKAANVPIVVAISKIDKTGADVDNVRTQLAQQGLNPEEWGGKTIMVPISSKSGEGIDKLLEMVLLQAEVLELKANPSRRARGVIVESLLDKGRGAVATVLIQNGSLKVGDYFVTGAYSGRVRTMSDERGRTLKQVVPGQPVQVTGADGVPQAGESFVVCEDEHTARHVSQMRERVKREQTFHRIQKTTLANVYERIQEGEVKDLKLVLKGDVDGSVEVLADTLSKISNEEVQVNIIHRGVGAISESDVLLAAASAGVIVGFHVRPDARAREVAAHEGVDIRLYDVIYEVESDIRAALEGMLAPEQVEEQTGIAVVKNIFKISRVGTVAGCEITEGTVRRGEQVRIVRDGVTIYTGAVQTVRRFSDEVKEVSAGLECGIKIQDYNDIKVGDSLELFRIVEHERKLV